MPRFRNVSRTSRLVSKQSLVQKPGVSTREPGKTLDLIHLLWISCWISVLRAAHHRAAGPHASPACPGRCLDSHTHAYLSFARCIYVTGLTSQKAPARALCFMAGAGAARSQTSQAATAKPSGLDHLNLSAVLLLEQEHNVISGIEICGTWVPQITEMRSHLACRPVVRNFARVQDDDLAIVRLQNNGIAKDQGA